MTITEVKMELLKAQTEGFAQVGAIAAEDSAAELPIGVHKFVPNGVDAYTVKRVTVPQTSTSKYAGQKIAFVTTLGKVVIEGGKSFIKNLGGEHTNEIPCYVTKVGKYNKLTSYVIEAPVTTLGTMAEKV